MKSLKISKVNFYYLLFFFFFASVSLFSQSVFELKPAQSMSITGQGPGQDAAFNPYSDTTSVAIVENIGEKSFTIRIRSEADKITRIPIDPKETEEVILPKGSILYLDSEFKSKAKIDFKKFVENQK